MKKAMIALLSSAITALTVASCGVVGAQSPETVTAEVTWERLFYKDDLKRIQIAAFSPDGERFLVSDGYNAISLWKKPFLPLERNVPIEDYEKIVTLQFFGQQHDVFVAVSGGTTQIWDQDMQTLKFAYQFPSSSGSSMGAITVDSRFIAWHGDLYDRRKKSLVGRSAGHAVDTGISFGSRSLLLTAGYHDQSIAVRNIFSGELEYRRLPHPVTDGAVSPNEKYAVAVTRKGRCYLWNWPDQNPKVLAITREDSDFGGFSPDSKWFVIRGDEFLHVFQSNPPIRIARLEHEPGITSVHVASNNLIAMGDRKGDVHIFDVSAARMIAQHKVLAHGVWPLELAVDNGYLWAASISDYSEKGEQGEIALYHVKGLEPYIEPRDAVRKK
ncbi:MAG: WD40 repeat domain-containing protein [Desulfobacteraceae bacterium]|jgi:WD40 repeat protein